MVSTEASLRKELKSVGLTRRAIDAVWPEWWSAEAESSLSATAELRYTVARRLGISPYSLFEGRPTFVWRDEAKFKNLGTTTEVEQSVLTSFGMAVGRALLSATPEALAPVPQSAVNLRKEVLKSAPYVRLVDIVSACWSFGIPVAKLAVHPLGPKRMQAMTICMNGRYAVLLGRDSHFPAWISFILAHEIGHIANSHVESGGALLEMADPLRVVDRDAEETQADRYALSLLTGQENPQIETQAANYSARQVAAAAQKTSLEERIDPGVLALGLAYSTKRWRQSVGALKIMDRQEIAEDVGVGLNRIAASQLAWDSISAERVSYLRTVMGLADD